MPAPELDCAYCAEVEAAGEERWYELLDEFEDANIYQTWAYEQVRSGRATVSRMVLKRGEEVVALAQARIVKMPVLNLGIAYVRWGPVWRRRGRAADPAVFRHAIRALRNEYVTKRGLTLRLLPLLFRDTDAALEPVLAQEGFLPVAHDQADRTLMLNVSRPLDELRACLRPHWRRELKNAEKHRLEIVEGTDEALFRTFVSIYREMVARKNFREPNKIEQFVAMQSRLPERFKARILLCQSEGAVCAGLVTSVAGNTAIYLFGATGDAGLKASGAYLLQWRFIEALNRSGIPTYDLNGINPVNNPGTYRFKAELCGNAGRDTYFLGRYDTHPGMVSRSCVAFGKRIMAASRIIRACAQAKPTVKRQEGAR